MATKYEGLTSAQWANRIVDYNPGKFDKSALVKHYTAQQLGKFQEGGNIQLAKALKGAKTAKKSSDEDAVKFIKKTIVKTEAPPAPARTGKSLEIEKFLRQVAFENGIQINFDKCPGGVCKPAPKKQQPAKKQPASKKKPDDDLYSDDSDLESCDDEDE